LDDWIYWHLIHTIRDYRQYSAIADLHILQFTFTHARGFSVFTSRILATDLLQSHCNLKSHMNSPLQFNSFIVISFQLPSTAISRTLLNSIPLLPSSYPGRLASRNSTNSSQLNYSARTTQKTQRLYCWEGVFAAPLHGNGSYSTVFVIRCRGNLFTEPLPSNKRLFWLHYSGFRASCHKMATIVL
jgi:hypothetical protein